MYATPPPPTTAEVAEVRYVENNELKPEDFGLEGKLQEKPQDKPKKKALIGNAEFMAKQYLNDPNANQNSLLWKQMHDIATNDASGNDAGIFAIDYILKNEPGTSDYNFAVSLWKQTKNQPGYEPDPEKEVNLYKKLIKEEPNNWENYKEILKVARGPPIQFTPEEWIQYSDLAIQKAPKDEKVNVMGEAVQSLIESYKQSGPNQKIKSKSYNIAKQMASLDYESSLKTKTMIRMEIGK